MGRVPRLRDFLGICRDIDAVFSTVKGRYIGLSSPPSSTRWEGHLPHHLCRTPRSGCSVKSFHVLTCAAPLGTSWIAVWFKLDETEVLVIVSGTW